MGTKYAILGLLNDRPMHGYEIKRCFEEMVSNVWSINYGRLYPLLKRMEQEGLIKKETVVQENRPDKLVYEITEAGKEDLQQWLLAPEVKRQIKDEFYLKMLFLKHCDLDTANQFMKEQMAVITEQFQKFNLIKEQWGNVMDPYSAMLLEAGIMHSEADIKWLELCKERINQEKKNHIN